MLSISAARRTRLALAVAAALTSAGLLAAGSAHAEGMVDLDAPLVAEHSILLAQGQQVLETRDCTPGADPVLHLLRPPSYTPAGSADSGGATARDARLALNLPGPGFFHLVVRAKAGTPAGSCTVLRNGTPLRTVIFGAPANQILNLTGGDELVTVRRPNGAPREHRIFLIGSDGVTLRAASNAGGMAGGAKLRIPADLGNVNVMVGVGASTGAGVLRLVHNDPGSDADRDGAGNALEARIGTCSTRSGRVTGNWDCGRIADARDTDGDGLHDGWEVLGKEDGRLTLPLWGADPRHKDMFAEVDFMRRTAEENATGAALRMTPDAARQFAMIYADTKVTDPSVKRFHALYTGNPDGKPGISVHLDTGVAPEKPEDATIYGNWGGYTAVNAVKSGSEFAGANARTAWKTNMAVARRGVFGYHLGYAGGGGQAGEGFAVSYNFADGPNAAHETGHSLGIGHGGPFGFADPDANCKPNHPSVMNYAFLDGSQSFSGKNIVGTGPNTPGRSEYYGPLNNTALVETGAVPPDNTNYLDILQTGFGYTVDRARGDVDWNRDGRFAPAGQTVRAYANFRPGALCEFTRFNQLSMRTTEPGAFGSSQTLRKTDQAPVLQRLDGRLYAFYVAGGKLKYAATTSKLDCPKAAASGCDDTKFSRESDLGLDATRGFDVERIHVRGSGSRLQRRLLVVAVDQTGKLHERLLELDGSNERWSKTAKVGTPAASGPPSLAGIGTGLTVRMAYRIGGFVMTAQRSPEGAWTSILALEQVNNSRRLVRHDQAADPALFEATLDGRHALYGLFTTPSGPDGRMELEIFRWDAAAERWLMTDLFESTATKVVGRPAVAWNPRLDGSRQGRLYVAYVFGNDEKTVRMLMSHVRPPSQTQPSRERVGLMSDFDNVWFGGYGISLLYDQGVDTNLRAAVAAKVKNVDQHILIRPKADGIVDITYKRPNEWPTLAWAICRYTVDPGDTVPDGQVVKCPAKPNPKG